MPSKLGTVLVTYLMSAHPLRSAGELGQLCCQWRVGCFTFRTLVPCRRFRSKAVDARIAQLVPMFKDPALAQLFANCWPNTLDTTVHSVGSNDTFVITGDIDAMWLRDSTNQILPYLPFVSQDTALAGLVHGVIARQAAFITADPYANAFQMPGSLPSPHIQSDSTSKPGFAGTRLAGYTPIIFERKYEVDSLAAFLKLSGEWFAEVGQRDTTPFQSVTWVNAVATVLDTFTEQQASTQQEDVGAGPVYTFQRTTSQPSDSLEWGRGAPAGATGLIKTGFRPSDDAAKLPFNIPQNAMAVVALRSVVPALSAVGQTALAAKAGALARSVEAAIAKWGTVDHPVAGKVYAYEVDGFGSAYFMDDANVPSLLSLPYLGFKNLSDPLLAATRAGVLSRANPWFFNGSVISGVGSPHTGQGRVWPMSLIVQAWSSDNPSEIEHLLGQLLEVGRCTGLMHESVAVDDAGGYTRAWFAWANSFFGSLVLKVAQEHPSLILKQALPQANSGGELNRHRFRTLRRLAS